MDHNENPLSRRAFCTGLAATVGAAPLFFAPAAAAAPVKEAPPRRYADMFGEVRHVFTRYEDTLLDMARQNGLGYVEMIAANRGIDPWVPGAGQPVTLPTAHLLPTGPREGLLLNLVDQRVYFFPPDGGPIQTYAIGTGQEAWDTPVGSTKIMRKKRNPNWYVPKSIREEQPELPAVVRAGPDNPLGHRAMYLGWPAYLIHGTNNPWGVGRRVSHGCIRMYPEGIEELFPQVPVGTPVTVVSQEAKTGWHEGELYLEVHPNLEQNTELEESGEMTPAPVPELAYRIAQAAGNEIGRVNWRRVNAVARERSGLPVPILKPAPGKRKEAASET